MGKFLTGVICAAVLVAASAGLAAAQQYPTCTSKSDDKCMQGGMMPGAAKMPMHKGAKKMGGAMKAGAGPMKKMMGAGAPSESNIPHGCSPVTTPCE